jgi:hypothetical protein
VCEDLDLRGAELPKIEVVDVEIPGGDFSAACVARADFSKCCPRQIKPGLCRLHRRRVLLG